MSGIMAITGSADGPPVKPGSPVADLSAGLYAFGGDLRGAPRPRRHRPRHRRGRRHVRRDRQPAGEPGAALARHRRHAAPGRQRALLDRALRHLRDGGPPDHGLRRERAPVRGRSARRWICRTWPGRPALRRQRRPAHAPRARSRSRSSSALRTAGCAHWLAVLEAAGVPCGPVAEVGEALSWSRPGPGRWWSTPAACRCRATRSRWPTGPTRAPVAPSPGPGRARRGAAGGVRTRLTPRARPSWPGPVSASLSTSCGSRCGPTRCTGRRSGPRCRQAPADLGLGVGAPVRAGGRHPAPGQCLRDAVGGRARVVGVDLPLALPLPERSRQSQLAAPAARGEQGAGDGTGVGAVDLRRRGDRRRGRGLRQRRGAGAQRGHRHPGLLREARSSKENAPA